MRREVPFALSFLMTIGLILLVWQVLPQWLLSGAADRATDEAREVAGDGIGEAIFLSFVWTSVVALVLGSVWGMAPNLGRSRQLDDTGGRSKLPHWWTALGLVMTVGGVAFWWHRGRIEGLGENWLQASIFYAFALMTLAVAAYAFQIVTHILAAPHMRPSIPGGVSTKRGRSRSRMAQASSAAPDARARATAVTPGQSDGRS